MTVILEPVYTDVIVRDGQDETPFTRLIWQATFEWEPGKRSEDFRWLKGYGASQEAAVAALHAEMERVQP